MTGGFGEIAERLRRSTVQVRSARGGSGSGVVWPGEGIVVTNAHLVRSNGVVIEAEDYDGRPTQAITYMAQGKELDGRPSLRYITLLRDGARAHGLPESYIRFLDGVEHAQ